jgi:hypothetical protein
MKLFIERFLIPALAAVGVGLVLTNPLHWGWWSRGIGFTVTGILALVLSYWHQRWSSEPIQKHPKRWPGRMIVDWVFLVLYVGSLVVLVWFSLSSFISSRRERAVFEASTVVKPRTDGPPAPKVPIPPDITPAYLTNLYKGKTTIEGDRLAAPYIGKWMTVTGKVADLRESKMLETTQSHVYIDQRLTRTHGIQLMASIADSSKDRALLLRRDDEVSLWCRIDWIDYFSVTLDSCDLVKP